MNTWTMFNEHTVQYHGLSNSIYADLHCPCKVFLHENVENPKCAHPSVSDKTKDEKDYN